jgi:hypothetical protein
MGGGRGCREKGGRKKEGTSLSREGKEKNNAVRGEKGRRRREKRKKFGREKRRIAL